MITTTMLTKDTLVFNTEVYENLVDADDPGFAVDISNQWIEQARGCVPELLDLLKREKWVQLSEKGHFLKGSAAFVGADRVKELCEEIHHKESYARPGESATQFYRSRIESLPGEIDAYETELYRRKS